MGLSTFIKNLLPDFLKSSSKEEETVQTPVVESIQDVCPTPLQVTESQPKVEQVVERLAEVSVKEIKAKVSKKPVVKTTPKKAPTAKKKVAPAKKK